MLTLYSREAPECINDANEATASRKLKKPHQPTYTHRNSFDTWAQNAATLRSSNREQYSSGMLLKAIKTS